MLSCAATSCRRAAFASAASATTLLREVFGTSVVSAGAAGVVVSEGRVWVLSLVEPEAVSGGGASEAGATAESVVELAEPHDHLVSLGVQATAGDPELSQLVAEATSRAGHVQGAGLEHRGRKDEEEEVEHAEHRVSEPCGRNVGGLRGVRTTMPVRTTVVREAGGTAGAGVPTRSEGPAAPAPTPVQRSSPGNLEREYRARERASEPAPARESAPQREAAPAPQRKPRRRPSRRPCGRARRPRSRPNRRRTSAPGPGGSPDEDEGPPRRALVACPRTSELPHSQRIQAQAASAAPAAAIPLSSAGLADRPFT